MGLQLKLIRPSAYSINVSEPKLPERGRELTLLDVLAAERVGLAMSTC
jgi:hypothetical protein